MSVLTIDVHVEAAGTVVVRPHGEIDAENAHEVREAVTSRLTGDPTSRSAIKIDLCGVSFIDSVGVGVLVGCFHAAAAYGVKLTVVNPTAYVHRILYISGLLGLFGSPAVGGTTASDAVALQPDIAR
jgi:anti-sigma B factor antagonist